MDVGGIVMVLVVGLVAGVIARAVVPGKQDLGLLATVALGLIGSVVGNLAAGLVRDGEPTLALGGWWASIAGAVVVLALYVGLTGRGRRR